MQVPTFLQFYVCVIAVGQVVGMIAAVCLEGLKESLLMKRPPAISRIENVATIIIGFVALALIIGFTGVVVLFAIDGAGNEDTLLSLVGLFSAWLVVRRSEPSALDTLEVLQRRFDNMMEETFGPTIERLIDKCRSKRRS